MYAPMGDGGVYEYVEPWYGFAVKKESDAQDYTKHGSCLAWMIWKCLAILIMHTGGLPADEIDRIESIVRDLLRRIG